MPYGIDLTAFPCLDADLDRVRDLLGPVRIPGRPELAALTGDQPGTSRRLVRPTLALLSYYVLTDPTEPADDRAVRAAAAVELVHLGSLYHDDVIDHSYERRGRASANAVWGAPLAVLAGDCVTASGLRMLAELGRREALAGAGTCELMCAAMVTETADRHVASRSEQSYLDTIDGKTAGLLSLACRVGAIQAARGQEQEDALARFGQYLGLAYQLRDDILDLTSTAEQMGKPVNADLPQGVYSLPVIRAAAQDAGLRRLLRDGMTQEEATHVRELVVASGVMDEAQAVVDGLVEQAAEQLTALACSSHVRRAMIAYARAVLDQHTPGPAVPRQRGESSSLDRREASPRRTMHWVRSWFLDSGLAADPAELDHHRLADVFHFRADALPRTDPDRAETAVGLLAMGALWDDLFEDPRLTDPRAVTALRRALVATLRQDQPGPRGAIPTAWARLWPRLREGRTADWQERFLDSFEKWCEASEREAHHRISGYVPSTADCPELRMATSGRDIALAFYEVWKDREIPPKVRRHPVARRLEELVFSVALIENDLATPEQDEADQVPYNLIRSVRHETGCTHQEAVAQVERHLARQRAQLDAVTAHAPAILRTLPGLSSHGKDIASIYENLMSQLSLFRGLDRNQVTAASPGPDLERLRREVCSPAAPARSIL
ncbi:polyprenyl synthetase family protein [Streptomyces sp. AK02-01A]|uniref:polyprenyl synthetase family protein n=1 Tax=Streptomyces sp. AK02-01A TaxID=3028648 RepID=UPI0029B75431|nr:polyprenyl synthetase family protein [Streptomyces sp. AK02-01A]MDX3853739.1 polyprenyl synthetase family protein [Streptomyces sp. AK02-01A]